MKKTLIYTLIFLYGAGSTSSAFGAGDEICGSQTGYNLYTCRVENTCKKYKSPKPVYNSKEYEKADSLDSAEGETISKPTKELDAIKKLYRDNMGNIYKCGIIQSQRNALIKLQDFVAQENSGKLSDTIGRQMENRLRKLEISSDKIGCTLSDSDTIQNKRNILYETTYQACKHINYLEYLKSYYERFENSYAENYEKQEGNNNFSGKINPRDIENDLNTRKNAVGKEIAHTYEVFPIAYQAYSEYENNFPIHYLLEIIRADFLLLRQTLKESIMPIAQLGLKIINAMSQ